VNTLPLVSILDDVDMPTPDTEDAGLGALRTARGLLPLEAVDLVATVDGLTAHLRLTQTFVNVHAEPLEATYIFPLPERAAVQRFRLQVGDRITEGTLKERGQARREYREAISQGHQAAITEEERPGTFTMRVGNIPPGESATVHLELAQPLPCVEGEATFRFPLVVAPRYIPGAPLGRPPVGSGAGRDTSAVPDASRITPPVLLPGFPNPVALSLQVVFPASDLRPLAFRSSLHTVMDVEDGDGLRLRVLAGERLNRDFILRFRLADRAIRTSLTLHPDADGQQGTFALTVLPPILGEQPARPRDLIFVLDRSGSMAGWKMVTARRAVARLIETLTDQDRFTVYAFDDRIDTPPTFNGDRLLPATFRNRTAALEFLSTVNDRGGTEMAAPLDLALARLLETGTERGRDRVLVLITDGQVGNEAQLVKQLGSRLKHVRVHALGIDQAVNAGFLQQLADLGGGSSVLVESEERLEAVIDLVQRRIGTPVLTGLTIHAEGLAMEEGSTVPARLPDLFAGTPLVILGRYDGNNDGSIALSGQSADGVAWSMRVPAKVQAQPALPALWARQRLRDLEDRYTIASSPDLERTIIELSLRFGVLCKFTSFVAVDRSRVVNAGGKQHQVTQAVEMPAGWKENQRPAELVVTELVSVLRCELHAPQLGAMPALSAAVPEAADLELAEEEKTVFETNLDVPALEDESGSVAIPVEKTEHRPGKDDSSEFELDLCEGSDEFDDEDDDGAADDADLDDVEFFEDDRNRTTTEGPAAQDRKVAGREQHAPKKKERRAAQKLNEQVKDTERRRDAAPADKSAEQKSLGGLLEPSGLFARLRQFAGAVVNGIRSLLGMARKAAANPLDRGPFRGEIDKLLAVCRTSTTHTVRLAVLENTLRQLYELVQKLTQAGDYGTETQRLALAVQALGELVGRGVPDEAALSPVWGEVTAALEAYRALIEPENFWK
jgi:Ca-activated chloride channel family protein